MIADHRKPGDEIIFSQRGAARFGLAYYLLVVPSRPVTLAGLDGLPSRSDPNLITTEIAADRNSRNWLVVPDGESPAVELAAHPEIWSLAFQERVSDLSVQRFDKRRRPSVARIRKNSRTRDSRVGRNIPRLAGIASNVVCCLLSDFFTELFVN